MRVKGLLTAIAIMLSTLAMQAQEQMFEKFSNHNDISTVFISKALLSMAGNMDMGKANIKGLANKLEKMEIYNGESKSAIALMKTEANKLANDKTYEVLMKVKEKGENVTFYAKKEKDDRFRDLIMFVDQPNDCSIIRIVGLFTMEDIKSVMNDKK